MKEERSREEPQKEETSAPRTQKVVSAAIKEHGATGGDEKISKVGEVMSHKPAGQGKKAETMIPNVLPEGMVFL